MIVGIIWGWPLAFVTMCPTHKLPLIERCQNCYHFVKNPDYALYRDQMTLICPRCFTPLDARLGYDFVADQHAHDWNDDATLQMVWDQIITYEQFFLTVMKQRAGRSKKQRLVSEVRGLLGLLLSAEKAIWFARRVGLSLKSTFPNYYALRADFSDRLDRVIAENSRMLPNALTLPDTVPVVSEADLRDVSDAKAEALNAWDARLESIFREYQNHPQRLRPLRTAMEERLMRAFAGLINQLRQEDLGIERYIWRSQDEMPRCVTATQHMTTACSGGTTHPKESTQVRRTIAGATRNQLR